MVVPMIQCWCCARFRGASLTCEAFPSGIPMVIYNNMVDHRKPFEGDNGIVFQAESEFFKRVQADIFKPDRDGE